MGGAAICSILYVLDTLGVSAGQKAAGTSGVLITASEGGFSPCRRVSSGSAPLRSWQKAAGSSTLKPCARQAAFHQDCPPAPLTLAGNIRASSNIFTRIRRLAGGGADIEGLRCVEKQTSTAGACAPLQPRLRLVEEAHRGIREKNDADGTAGVQGMDTPSGHAQPWGTQENKEGNDGFKEKGVVQRRPKLPGRLCNATIAKAWTEKKVCNVQCCAGTPQKARGRPCKRSPAQPGQPLLIGSPSSQRPRTGWQGSG